MGWGSRLFKEQTTNVNLRCDSDREEVWARCGEDIACVSATTTERHGAIQTEDTELSRDRNLFSSAQRLCVERRTEASSRYGLASRIERILI